MTRYVEGADAVARKLKAIKHQLPEALRPVLLSAGEVIAADSRALAEVSRRSGDLIDRIEVKVEGFEVRVEAKAPHSHLVEGGTMPRIRKDGSTTGRMPAAPFFNNAFRLNRRRLKRRIMAALRRAAKKAMAE
ncbi:MAG: HK97-gp10 family putative phage morphogenesis protein [Hyphomonas sp.]